MQYFQADEKTKARWIIFVLSIVPAAAWIIIPPMPIPADPLYGTLQVSSSRLCLIFNTLAFAIAWNAFGEQLKFGTIVFGITLFGAATLDFLYLGASLGVPSLLPLHEVADAAPFWLAARLLTALGALSAVLLSSTTVISRRRACLLLSALLTALALYAYNVITRQIASGRIVGMGGANILKNIANYSAAILFFAAAVFLYIKLEKRNTNGADGTMDAGLHRLDIFAGTSALFIAQLFFISSPKPGAVASLIGPVYQLMAALFLYRGIAASSIKLPYRALAQLAERLQATTDALHASRARLAGVIDTATDGIVVVDETQVVVMANPAAAAMFGATLDEMQDNPIEKYIPLRHRRSYQSYMKSLRNARISFVKTSKTHRGHDVTGVRASGEEFPIEASISSMVESGRRFYTLILRDITERRQAEEALAKSHEELTHLSNALQKVREEERRAIARDLHDNLGQLLATLRNDLSLLQQKTADSLAPENLSGMDALLTSSITSLRRIATDLRPRALDEGGLYFALQTLAKEFAARNKIACELIANERELALDDQRSTLIFRVVQESLATIFRQGGAQKVTIECRLDEERLEISLRDDGRGIRIEEMDAEMSIGIINMRERLRAMKGEIAIAANEKRGTRIDIALPVTEQKVNQ